MKFFSKRDFGRAWGRLRVPKMFRFRLSFEKLFSGKYEPMLNLSASSFATLSQFLSLNVSSYVVNGSNAFEARRAAIAFV